MVIFSHRFLDSDCINSKLLHSWLFIDLSEHHYTALTSKFNNFVNRSSMMLNNVFKVKDKIIKQISAFNYLGSTMSEDSRCVREVKRRIALAKSAFSKLAKILRNRTLGKEAGLRVLHCYIHPVLMYGSEAWSITSDLRKRLDSCEMWFLRRMMRIPWTDKLTNEEVLQRAVVERKLVGEIRTRQMRFLGHVIRKDGLENLALTEKIEGKRVEEENGCFG